MKYQVTQSQFDTIKQLSEMKSTLEYLLTQEFQYGTMKDAIEVFTYYPEEFEVSPED